MAKKTTHKDVEFAVDDATGKEHIFKSFNEAAGFAVGVSAYNGRSCNLDVLIYSSAGARWWGGENAAEEYEEDPDASVSDRIEVQVNTRGRVA